MEELCHGLTIEKVKLLLRRKKNLLSCQSRIVFIDVDHFASTRISNASHKNYHPDNLSKKPESILKRIFDRDGKKIVRIDFLEKLKLFFKLQTSRSSKRRSTFSSRWSGLRLELLGPSLNISMNLKA